uniref:Uncharacterized protein n=1 Tax=Klebsiella pneumoniae TaxID=573 RepID=A0A8B0SSS8_KLEPN|nr:hypothetical protein [Klebsiella pneumoniae]
MFIRNINPTRLQDYFLEACLFIFFIFRPIVRISSNMLMISP